MSAKLEKKTNLRIDLVESDLQSKVDRKALTGAIDDSWARKQEVIESNIAKKLEDKDKKRTDQLVLAFDSKVDGLKDKIKTVEVNFVDVSSDVRKLKLEGSSTGTTTSYRSSVSLPVAPTFNKNEVLDEIKKVEQQLNQKLSKSEQKTADDITQTRSDLSDLQRKVKSTQNDLLDTKTQTDKQAGKIKQIEDDLRKSDSLLLLVQNNLKKHTEFIDKEKEREAERQRLVDSIKLLEENQKKIAAEIAEGNEQVERVLREEAAAGAGSGSGSINNSISNGGRERERDRDISSHSPISSPAVVSPSSSSVPRSPLLSKRNSSAFTSSPQITSRSPSSDLSNDEGENGILWEYDPIIDKWIRLSIKLKVERRAFAEGALRQAYHTVSLGISNDVNYPLGTKHSFPAIESISPVSLRNEASNQLQSGTKFVLKLYKKEAEQQTSRELYFEDVKMQMVCRDWGHRFNQKKPPKKIEFCMSWVVELVDRGSTPVLCSIEPLLVGEFKKNNSNYGAVLTNRSTPQAFSHFTYENSNKQMIIIDIQGVDDLYTDPQIHTGDGKGFGLGNLGKTGINKFITSHKCNAVCALLNLDVKLGGSSLLSKQQLNKGTMIMPDIVGDLESGDLAVKVGANELPRADFGRKELKCVNTIQSFRESINAVCFFDNDRYVCAGYGDGVMRVFDLHNNWQIAQTFYCHRKPIVSVCANSKYIFTSSPDQTIKVHSLKNPHNVIQTFIGHSGEVSCIRANETHLFSCSYDKTIRVWDLTTFREAKTMEQMHTKYIKTLCLSGRYLFSGGNDQTIYVWDTENFTCLFNMPGHDDWVLSLHVAGAYLFSTSKDNQIKIWDLTDFHCIETLKGHWNSVSSSVVNDRFLYSGSEDNSIKVWDMDTLECSYTMQKAHSLGVKSLAFYKSQLISSSFDGSIKIWEWASR
ncbi:myosin heavy chain kinase [Cavenderia fasciculata]|uniref:Myosin heavy chain kinase n=1 Tax=Cavenderia fasciculata TaxID=261658 RepID=F4PUL2_CACFS|nr:myosin heavy chain kinase [Cavenderia fasciculata]EGG21876.1 myosin heavy chain kinase [Cavenderia fasciculata]|eukprot:XP_004359727.1 myosin heavy chain kinase [Cavenderia fasciculata]